MNHPNFILLYVKSPAESAAFYSRLLGAPTVEASPTFAMLALESGVMLGLWASAGVEPAATLPGGSELAIAVKDDAMVEARLDAWLSAGAQVLQPLTRMDFGYTFTVADPDGHRLRVFAPAGQ